MEKNYFLILVFLILVITPLIPSISAEDKVCCQETLSGASCQMVPPSECAVDSRAAEATSCDATDFCKIGTCVNPRLGLCESKAESICVAEGSEWHDSDMEDVPMCRNGCCLYADQFSFVTKTECKRIATDYGVNVDFLSNIVDEGTCSTYANPKVKGACVIQNDEESNDCIINTKEECQNIGGEFHEGLLCTAKDISDCAPSDETTCYNDDVYFVDTCGNLANIYDSSLFSKKRDAWSKEIRDYWTYIKEDYEQVYEGDCDYNSGTICKEIRGKNVCSDLSCSYDSDGDGNEEKYDHGESWCAHSEGAFPEIRVDPETMEFLDESQRLEIEQGVLEYNLPGTRYYKLYCWEGEVFEEPCADYRNEICKEAVIGEDSSGGDFTIAQCRTNGYRVCMDIQNKEDCENPSLDCKWIGYEMGDGSGYRFDEATTQDPEMRKQEQGSCVPLYAPGLDFWSEDSEDTSLCNLGDVQETVLFETYWTKNRDDFSDESTRSAASRCYDSCYAIPDYGVKLPLQSVIGVYNGLSSFDKEDYLSRRRGAYCYEQSIWNQATGWIFGDKIDTSKFAVGGTGSLVNCASTDRKVIPEFYTHEQWLNFIKDRAKSLGDCGYKPNVAGIEGEESSEIVSVIFQKLSQDGEIKENGSIEIIYRGDSRISDTDYRGVLRDIENKAYSYYKGGDYSSNLDETESYGRR
jgi:hypothetical protein